MLDMFKDYIGEIRKLFEYLEVTNLAPLLFFIVVMFWAAYCFGRAVALKQSRFAIIVTFISCILSLGGMGMGILNVYAFGLIDGTKMVLAKYCKDQKPGYVPYHQGMTLCPGQWTSPSGTITPLYPSPDEQQPTRRRERAT